MNWDQYHLLAGVDEVGRGALAGPVAAAAVILGSEEIAGLDDSKVLSAPRRVYLAGQIRQHAVAWCVACASAREIEQINIRQASLLAMLRAVEGLSKIPDKVLVDGNCLPRWSYDATSIIGGDRKIEAISAASILAKVWRDSLMIRLHDIYPVYAFASNKGYPTPRHLAALQKFGATTTHRCTFAPVRRLLSSVAARDSD